MDSTQNNAPVSNAPVSTTPSTSMPNLGEMTMSFVLMAVFVVIVFLIIVQYCWNNTISVLTNSAKITIWQSFLLLLLFHILFNNGCYVQK